MNFTKQLITWYLANKRDLPWRETTNPYFIWLSEIILQQTRVQQGLPYYLSFINAYPTVFDLANAREEEILKLWQGLGYYSRARNLHYSAKYVAAELNGVFPNSFLELKKLKGVGDYTAAAIASFAYNELVPVVDGNVYRVLSRYFAIETDISSSMAKKEFFELAQNLIPNDNSHDFNQAIMDFGAIQCVPKNPDCISCSLNKDCKSFQIGKVDEFPVKSKKIKITHRYINYLLLIDNKRKSVVQKRIEKGIWYNLYELPNIETDERISEAEVVDLIKKDYPNIIEIVPITEASVLHKLSHQHLHLSFYKVLLSYELEKGLSLNEIVKLPFPIVLYNFLETCLK